MSNQSDILPGKVIAITGGARGIGFATASSLVALGAKVAIGDIDETTVKQSGADLDVYAGKVDVTDLASFTAFLDDVERELGPLDVLVNNAGIMPVGLLVDEPDVVTRRMLDINIYGVINGTKLAAQRMIPRGAGHVINIASLAGETCTPGWPPTVPARPQCFRSPTPSGWKTASPACTSPPCCRRSSIPSSPRVLPVFVASRTPSRPTSRTRSSDSSSSRARGSA
ncbi:hypothetical protein GCM10020255_086190 [Rhodococcus baikonurensis]